MNPALTAEEWAEVEVEWEVVDDSDGWAHIEDLPGDESLVYVGVFDDEGTAMAGTYVDRRKTAALCLHDQPFGFTRQDVEALRTMMNISDGTAPFHDIADRIEALLPPEPTD